MISMVSIDVNWLLYGVWASEQATMQIVLHFTLWAVVAVFQYISASTWLNDGKRQFD